MYVLIKAKCSTINYEYDISSTNHSLTCNKGEGMELLLLEPRFLPDKYFYIGTLIVNTDEKHTKFHGNEREELLSQLLESNSVKILSSHYQSGLQ